jgi:DNA polymerase-3 subunit delta
VKITARQIDGFLRNPPAELRGVLFYGPDVGLVRERSQIFSALFVEDPKDPFRHVDLEGKDIVKDPARLADESAAIAFGGGRRVILLRDGKDDLAEAVGDHLESGLGDAMVITIAGDLAPRSALRRTFEGADFGAAVPCYADENESLSQLAISVLREAGLEIERDALSRLVFQLGVDRRVSRQEVTKLALFKGNGPGTITIADVDEVIGDAAAHSLDDIALATASGSLATLDTCLARSFREGNESIAVLRAVSRHFQKLHLAGGYRDHGMDETSAMKKLRPPVFFKRTSAFSRQMRQWRGARLERAMTIISDAERECKMTGAPTDEICSRALFQVARAAQR